MAEYHGDVMYRIGNTHKGRDDKSYLLAIILLLFFGQWGVHRFYLGDYSFGLLYFVSFTGAVILSYILFDPAILLFESIFAGGFLLIELVYFIFKLFVR